MGIRLTDIVVYTVILDGYDHLRKMEWPGVCLSDGSVKLVPKWSVNNNWSSRGNTRVMSRKPKLLAHEFFPEAKYSIYLDGNIDLLVSPVTVVEKCLKECDIAVFRHPQRDCIYEEAKACIEYHKGDPKVIRRQMEDYRKQGYPVHFGLAACFVLVRRHTSRTEQFNRIWYHEFSKYKQRDQLCFDYVRWRTGIRYDTIGGNLLKNKSNLFHRGKHA